MVNKQRAYLVAGVWLTGLFWGFLIGWYAKPTGIQMPMPPDVVVTVADRYGKPIPNISVFIYDLQDKIDRMELTQADGKATFEVPGDKHLTGVHLKP